MWLKVKGVVFGKYFSIVFDVRWGKPSESKEGIEVLILKHTQQYSVFGRLNAADQDNTKI